MPTALITGSAGQDGIYLTRLLHAKGYEVAGIGRGGVCGEVDRGYEVELLDRDAVRGVVAECRPKEVYCLAAFHQPSEGAPCAEEEWIGTSLDVNTIALNQMLGALAVACPAARLLYAASSRVFGEPISDVQNEDTPFSPVDPYGIAKTAGIQICRYWRRSRGLFAVSAILYNHESPLRPPSFLSRKIVRAAACAARGGGRELPLGNLSARVDWGHASDSVRAMWLMLQQPDPADFVVATGQLHTVRDWLDEAFGAVLQDWRALVTERPRLLHGRQPTAVLCGDASRLRKATGWQPEITFQALVRDMLAAELSRWEGAWPAAGDGPLV